MKLIPTTVALVALTSASPLMGDSNKPMSAKNAKMSAQNDIVETAASAGSFTTLLAAAKAAGLVEALKGDGPITVFAPTDEAFAKLPKGTVESLLQPENKSRLVDILTYHVVSGAVPFKTAVGLDKATALNKKEIAIKVVDGRLFLNESQVVKNDIAASNGIIHVIDSVLQPPASKEKASATDQLLMDAIAKGVPHFNHGQHGACADIYEMAVRGVMMVPNTNEADRKVLQAALHHSGKTASPTTRAWTLRKAMDLTLASSNE